MHCFAIIVPLPSFTIGFKELYSLEYRMSGGGALDIHSMFRVSHQESGWEVRMYMGALLKAVQDQERRAGCWRSKGCN